MEAPMLATFSLSIILQSIFLLIWRGNARSVKTLYTENSLALGPIQIPQMYVISFVIALALAWALHLFVTRTMVGKAIRATAQSSRTAAVMGVNVDHIYALTHGLGAAIAAVGGVLVATTFSFVPSTGLTYLLKGFVLVALGGMGSITGTLLGGMVLGMSESLGAAAFSTSYKDMIGLLIFLLVLTIRPTGLFGRK
jgi:branched-chain amino acid transport system permease protein